MKKALLLVLILGSLSLNAQNKINYHPHLTKYIVENKILGEENFFIADVGASGGIASYWDAFGPYLSGVGFDILVKECERLNAQNSHPGVTYQPYEVVSENKDFEKYRNLENTPFEVTMSIFARSSAWSMMQNLNINYSKEYFNQGQELLFADQKISLDRYFSKKGIRTVDFIKTDTDGFDYSVLRGAAKLLDQGVLGLLVECDFNGPFHPCSNSFRNVDFFLVERGFRLYDLSIWRYTKKDLPGQFFYEIPAQTVTGQVSWGDAFYLRDFVEMKKQGKQIPVIQVIKMACIQEIFGLPDCAAELLMTFRKELESMINVDYCLDLLAKDMSLYPNYQKHMSVFNENPKAFYPKKN